MVELVRRIAKEKKVERFEGIINTLNSIGVNYKIDTIDHLSALGNIIVSMNNCDSEKIVVCAHYDNTNFTPGANDNASGCSILLKLIEEFKDKDKNIEFVFFDLEEIGLVGSSSYLKKNIGKIKMVINLDMCGFGNNTLYTFSNLNSNPFKEICEKHECIRLGKLPPGDNDTFSKNGIPTIDIVNATTKDIDWFRKYEKNILPSIFPDFLKTMHNNNDTIDTLNFYQMEKIYKLLEEMLYASI